MFKFLCVALIVFKSSDALNDAEMKAEFTKTAMQCFKDHPIDMQELTKLQTYVIPKNKESKCLLACTYRKIGTLNDKGMYDLKKAYEVAETAKDGDEKRLENGKKMADLCAKVNEEKVSDGEKGCDRASLMFKCMVENAPKFGFKL